MKIRTLSLGIAVATLLPLGAQAVFKCVDDKGYTRVGDTPPEQCANVVMYEVSSSGTVLRKIDPSLTPDQVRARTEEVERRKESDKALQEQKRKDLALLASFSTEQEFDTARDRNIEPLTGRIKSAGDRIAAIDKRLKDLDDEMEFYKAGKKKSKDKDKDGKDKAAPEVPAMLKDEVARLKHERETLAKNVAGAEREITNMRTKFDTDKRRWMALKSGTAPAMPGEAPPAPEAKADPKTEPKPAPKKPN
jgi:prefoldin subunit 5